MIVDHSFADFDATFDVLIIGAGGCGLVAALAAIDQDPEVQIAVIEKLDRMQGNTMLSSGSIPAANTRFQREAGVQDSPVQFIADLALVTGPHQALHLTERLAHISAELIEWLVDKAGVELSLVQTYKHIGHRVHRLHSPPSRRGADLMHSLFSATEHKDIPVAFGNPATELIISDDGTIVGAVTETPSGERTLIGAKAVILASNGFGANRDLLARFCPELSQVPYGGSVGSEGEAIVWGEELGAGLANMAAYQAHASLADPHGSLVTWTLVEKGGIIVDQNGCRFGDETIGYSAFAAQELSRQGPFYVIADTRIRDFTAKGQDEYAELCQYGGVFEAANVHDLAQRLSIPADQLGATLDAAMAAAQSGEPDEYGRQDWGLGPLHGPFTATRIGPALFHTQGGLRIDEDARVLRVDGGVITGLYAGGGAASGISGENGGTGYMSGNGLLCALGLGYLAGRAAVRDIQARSFEQQHPLAN